MVTSLIAAARNTSNSCRVIAASQGFSFSMRHSKSSRDTRYFFDEGVLLMNANVKFQDRRLGVICCGHVFRREREVQFVVHRKRNWQFMCGGTDHAGASTGNFVVVRVLLDFDPSLDELADLQPGWEAERRDPGSPWIRTRSGAGDA
jgi:hypothetical protein